MTLVHERYQMRTNQNGTKVYFLGFFLREASRMRTAVQSQNLKVKFYNFFWAVQIKNQTVGWVASHSTRKPSFQRNMNWLRFVVY